ncbi:MAG: hypothetical protein IID45_06555, partial [Planctomycetes bacterium]|nr:hypothetical protein [Planctomycetota bacterium]
AGGDKPPAVARFDTPQTCGACHPTHFKEWQGSIMHYAAESPVFNAFELIINKLTQGEFAANGAEPNFCIGCHSPTGVFNNELPDFVDEASALPSRDSLSPVSREGLSCDFCHTVTGPAIESSLLQDGIANTSLEFSPSYDKVGPIFDPSPSPYHTSSGSAFISSANFCGGCHEANRQTHGQKKQRTKVHTGSPKSADGTSVHQGVLKDGRETHKGLIGTIVAR